MDLYSISISHLVEKKIRRGLPLPPTPLNIMPVRKIGAK